jgi:protein tyrosine/serine phosphatase
MLFVDHGLFRLAYLNRHRLSDTVWRAAQPAPRDLRAFARDGIRTILNLRGPRDCGSYRLEDQTCAALGLRLINFTLHSRAAPSKATLNAAARLLQEIEYPMLMHCKSGADRAGLMSVLYLHLKQGVPMAEAKEQLSWRYGHFRSADTGILDVFFETYLRVNEATPVPFLEWVNSDYDPEALRRSFVPSGIGSWLLATVLHRE